MSHVTCTQLCKYIHMHAHITSTHCTCDRLYTQKDKAFRKTDSEVNFKTFTPCITCCLQAGNIYLADYELMEDISPNSTDPCTLQYLAAPICLLYNNSQSKILPLAIQVGYSVCLEKH